MRPVGSGANYYYGYSENQNGVVTMGFTLKDPIEESYLKTAVEKALKCFPTYAVSLTLWENNLYYRENKEPVPVRAKEKEYCLGKDSDGYLFGFEWQNRELFFYFFHLLGDATSSFGFLELVLMHYCSLRYETDRDWQNILEEAESKYKDQSMEDPYESPKLSLTEASTEKSTKRYGSLIEDMTQYEAKKDLFASIRIPVERLETVAAEFGITPYVLINVLMGNILEEKKGMEAEKIGAYMPIDLRTVLGVWGSPYNCLAFLNVDHNGKNNFASLEEQCRAYQAGLRKKLHYKKALAVMKEDALFQKTLQNPNSGVAKKCMIAKRVEAMTRPYRGTFVMSCIAFTEKDHVLNPYLCHLETCPSGSGMGILCELNRLGETECLSIRYHENAKECIECLVERLKQLMPEVSYSMRTADHIDVTLPKEESV